MAIRVDDGTGEIIEVPGLGIVFGIGTVVPADSAVGWAKGAIYLHSDGSGSADSTYINIGTKDAANFDPLDAGSGDGSLFADTISELTSGVGVTVSGGVVRLLSTTGAVFKKQGDPTAETTEAPTLAAADLLSGLITSTQAAAVTATLDTGTAMDTALVGTVGTNEGFYWSLINLGSVDGAVTVTAAAAGHTVVGLMTVPITTSATFFTRRTAANTWITYRTSP